MAIAKKAKVTESKEKNTTIVSTKTGLSADTKKILAITKGIIRKKHGEEAIQSSLKMNYNVISTGSLKIDAASGIGGMPMRTYDRSIWRQFQWKNYICY